MELRDRYLKVKRALFDKAYGTLNEAQRRAVFTTRGPLLVLAGAGSGKTTVLVKRIAFIIKYGNAYYSDYVPYSLTEERVAALERACREYTPEQIETLLPQFTDEPCAPWNMLAITFTNKAAGEIKSRLVSTFGDESVASDIWSGTFHSICAKILHQHGSRLGYDKGLTIYDADDTKRAIGTVMKELQIDEKTYPLKYVASEISRAKEKLMFPKEYQQAVAIDFRLKVVSRIYYRYQEKLKLSNAVDFDDIIMQTVHLLRENQDIREYYQNKFKYVCVDEYQDTNHAQFELTSMLSGKYENIMVVGDDDQSIYKFRGADITNILEFDKTYPQAKVIRMERNYRSTSQILEAANDVISHNLGRKGKKLYTTRADGNQIKLRFCDDQNAEARFIGDTIVDKVSKGAYRYRDFVILYRSNVQSRVMETALDARGIPYRVVCGQSFYTRQEIKDVMAYLQLINNHNDDEKLRRVINEPSRKIGKVTIEAVSAIAREQGCSMFDVVRRADEFIAIKRSSGILLDFAKLIDGLSKLLETDIPLDAFLDQVLERSGYRQMLINAGEVERSRLENVEELKSAIQEYSDKAEHPTLSEFLEEKALISEIDKYDESADAVVMMTIHSAKGLEFPVVFLPGMEEGVFPSSQSIQNMFGSGDAMEEERRLAYVAITRAKDELFLTHTKCRNLYGRTAYNPISRFVGEISESLIDREPKRQSVWQTAMENTRFQQHSAADNFKREKVTVASPVFAKPAPTAQKETFREGDIVLHATFGRGEILSVRPMGADTLYEVAFDKVGTKKLMATYARLKKA